MSERRTKIENHILYKISDADKADKNVTMHFLFTPQTPYLVETALSAVGERSVCPTPRCSSRNWKGSTPPINSSPRTKGGGYPRRRIWQRDKWQSGFRTGAWRRRKSSINSRAPVSSGDTETGGEGRTWMCLHPKNCAIIYYNIWTVSLSPERLCFDLHISFLTF